MPQDSTGREVIGLTDAAALAGVVHQTIENWAANKIIHVGREPATLFEMNHRKSGRKHTKYYYRDEIEERAVIEPTPAMISIDEAATQLGVTHRTIHRLRTRQDLPSFIGPNQTIYLYRKDIDKQELHKTYWKSPKRKKKVSL